MSRTVATIRMDPASNWTIFINGGSVVSTSDAYLNFENRYSEIWLQIRHVIFRIENVLQRYAVPCAEIKCTEILAAAKRIPASTAELPVAELRSMLFNSEEVIALIKKPGQMYKGTGTKSVPDLAARQIQNVWSKYKSQRGLQNFHKMMVAARVMIKSYYAKKSRIVLLKQINRRFEIHHKRRFYQLSGSLVREWKEKSLSVKSKVVLQMDSRLSNVDVMDFVLGRMMMLNDGMVETLILVIPFLSEEKEQYIYEQLASGFLDMNPLTAGRLVLVSPEASRCFAPGSSVAAMLNSSHKAFSYVKGLIEGKCAIMMTDTIGFAEIELSSRLCVPIFGTMPENAKKVNTRQKVRAFLKNAGLEVVPAMNVGVGPEYKLKEALVLLKSKYQDNVALWEVFEKRYSNQLDFGKSDGKPDGWIDANKVPKLEIPEEEALDEAVSSFTLSRDLKLHRCPSFPEFINHICGMVGPKQPTDMRKGTGAYIQACPVSDGTHMRRIEIGFRIDPKGQYSQLVTTEVILNNRFEQLGVIVPQQRLPHGTLLKLVERLLSACVKNKIYGYVSLQLSVWRDVIEGKNGWWANNFYPFTSPNLLKASSVLVSTGCEIDTQTGLSSFQWTDIPMHLEKTQRAIFANHQSLRQDFEQTIIKQAGGVTEQRVAIYADNLHHDELIRVTWRGFVNFCQRDGIRFNEKIRKGTYFPLVDTRTPARMPMVIVAADYKSAIVALLKDLTISHRRLKHYDLPDLVSNVKKKDLYEDDISSDSDDDLAASIRPPAASVTIAAITGSAPPRDFDVYTVRHRPLTPEEPMRRLDMSKIRVSRIADMLQPPAWWDILTLVPRDPWGVLRHIDPYDPANKDNKHFELDPNKHPRASEDLDTIVAAAIPALSKLVASSRPVTSCARKIREVLEEIERSKKPPPPTKASRSVGSINLLNEGIPSIIAAKYDPTFKKPEITPPFTSTERYLRMKRGQYTTDDMAAVAAALAKYEAFFGEPDEDMPAEKITPAQARNKEDQDFETQENIIKPPKDIAVEQALNLMNSVSDQPTKQPKKKGKSGLSRSTTAEDGDSEDYDDDALLAVAITAPRRTSRLNFSENNDKNVQNVMNKIAKLGERS
ncbi:hypothetical protein HDU98_002701 [Podochytrium sp. JEL0797]|nr:hypothetical protein HDU98_002701 [Podochytrium sp. JEL0797]